MWSDFSLVCQPQRGPCPLIDTNEECMGEGAPPDGAHTVVCCPALDACCRGGFPRARLSVAVMRHGERLDASDPGGWFRSAAGARYPFDCPLSAEGRVRVGAVAREVARRSSGGFSCVVTSPFLRCVETAAEVCRTLGLPICVDMQLGEVFGPACFGEWGAPGPPRRSAEEVAALVPRDLRGCAPVDLIGEEPRWPESVEEARLRLVARVEQYTEWAARLEGANFILVTHGDCVGACLTLAMARADGTVSQIVDKVDYCGYALLERVMEPGEPASVSLLDEGAKWQVQHGRVSLRDLAGDPPEPGWARREESAVQGEEEALLAHGSVQKGRGSDISEKEYFNNPWNGCQVTPGIVCI